VTYAAAKEKRRASEKEMEIIEFRESDIDAVFEIQQAAYKPLYEKYHDGDMSPYMESRQTVLQKYTREGTKGYVFVEDGVTVGAVRITLYPEEKKGRVSALGVLPEYQGRGIAQRALLAIEKIHSDVDVWFLDTILEEKGNCHLYEKLGYKQTGKTERINDRMTLIYYEK
jgi:ribosomal protein S18 acetylase RimI-like enzyme